MKSFDLFHLVVSVTFSHLNCPPWLFAGYDFHPVRATVLVVPHRVPSAVPLVVVWAEETCALLMCLLSCHRAAFSCSRTATAVRLILPRSNRLQEIIPIEDK